MISIREMVGVFFGRKPMEEFVSHRYTIQDGTVNFSAAFIFTGVLLVFEFLVFRMVLAFMAKQGTIKIVTDTAIYGVGFAVLTVVLLVAMLALTYIWGAVHFFLAKFYAGMPGSLNDFNGSWLSLMGSITLIQRLLLALPILAWFLAEFLKLAALMKIILPLVGLLPALLVQLYGVFLTFRFIRSRLSITNARAAIVVLLPLAVITLAALVLSIALMVLVGTKII